MGSSRKASFIRSLSLISLSLGLVGGAVQASEFVKNEVIVKYKANAVRTRSSANAMYDAVGVLSVKHYSGIMEGFEQLVLNDNVKVQDAIATLSKNPNVEYAQPNYILHTLPVHLAYSPAHGSVAVTAAQPCLFPGIPYPPGCTDQGGTPGNPSNPNPPDPSDPGTPTPPATRPALAPAPAEVSPPVADPEISKTYGMSQIGATDAWKEWAGSKDFIVADIDTGIDYNHEDLSFNVWRNPKPGDKNDIVGYDFVHDDGLPFDDNEHGTHTAGTIGAVGGNGKGVSGVAQKISLMSVKFLSGEGSGTTADAIRAIDYAIGHGAKVLSNSWGGKGDDNNQGLKDAIDRAKAKDVLFIAAAGNDGTDNDSDPDYPAGFTNDNLISVAATDETDGLAYFSNTGKTTVHLGAPGVNVYSTVPGNKYEQLSGTSMACPHVAGAAALIWSKHPDWDYKKVKATLLSTVDKLSALDGKTITGGRLNVLKALRSTE